MERGVTAQSKIRVHNRLLRLSKMLCSPRYPRSILRWRLLFLVISTAITSSTILVFMALVRGVEYSLQMNYYFASSEDVYQCEGIEKMLKQTVGNFKVRLANSFARFSFK